MCFKVMCNSCRCIQKTEGYVEEFLYHLCLPFNFEDQNFKSMVVCLKFQPWKPETEDSLKKLAVKTFHRHELWV